MSTKPEVLTFGCRLNSWESEVIRRLASEGGLEDVVILNSCGVTNEALRQVRQAVRKTRRERPRAEIVVTGCAAQMDPRSFSELPEVDRVIGNAEKLRPATWQRETLDAAPRVLVQDIASVKDTAVHLVDGFAGRTRAFVKVQDGCDHACTFCIIPQGRGRSRSVPVEQVVAQVRALTDAGCPEVVLTGVDTTSWGDELPGRPRLGRLAGAILDQVPELPRLRLSSVDAIELDDELLRLFAEEERLMPHLHLSLQAGDDLILKRMKRRHSRADAIAVCERVRELRPDVLFGADLIAGFPTESEQSFENSLRLVDDCGLTFLHVFPFSPRDGTPAARMPQLSRDLVKERAARLREKGEQAHARTLDGMANSTASLLVERDGLARTPSFVLCALQGEVEAGRLVEARLGARVGERLHAEPLARTSRTGT
jgi:threonylcarbamoyladenosine tRNA methylthiotransferase MtaB